jgi:hypothetical protein
LLSRNRTFVPIEKPPKRGGRSGGCANRAVVLATSIAPGGTLSFDLILFLEHLQNREEVIEDFGSQSGKYSGDDIS